MDYAFRNTYRESADSYIEDRGIPYKVIRGAADFSILDAEFSKILPIGSTAIHSQDQYGKHIWEIVIGCPFIEAEEAIKFANLRKLRDAKLAETDYILMADYPADLVKREKVVAYRQALRDLPSTEGAPWDGGYEATPWPVLD